jgi:hypothetical protein
VSNKRIIRVRDSDRGIGEGIVMKIKESKKVVIRLRERNKGKGEE